MGIGVAMSSSGPDALPAPEVLTAYMILVGLDESGQPVVVPQLRPGTPAERTLFREGQLRREFRRKGREGRAFGRHARVDCPRCQRAGPPVQCTSEEEQALYKEVGHRLALQAALRPRS